VPVETHAAGKERPKQNPRCSIHPQGWVPVETLLAYAERGTLLGAHVAFTPKGGCPLKQPLLGREKYIEALK